MSFDLEAEKRKTVKRLENLEKVGISYKSLKELLKGVSLTEVVTSYITTEAKKIETFASKNDIEFKIDMAELIALVKVDLPQAEVPVNVSVLPFTPVFHYGQILEDAAGYSWKWDGHSWSHESDWESSWESSQVC